MIRDIVFGIVHLAEFVFALFILAVLVPLIAIMSLNLLWSVAKWLKGGGS